MGCQDLVYELDLLSRVLGRTAAVKPPLRPRSWASYSCLLHAPHNPQVGWPQGSSGDLPLPARELWPWPWPRLLPAQGGLRAVPCAVSCAAWPASSAGEVFLTSSSGGHFSLLDTMSLFYMACPRKSLSPQGTALFPGVPVMQDLLGCRVLGLPGRGHPCPDRAGWPPSCSCSKLTQTTEGALCHQAEARDVLTASCRPGARTQPLIRVQGPSVIWEACLLLQPCFAKSNS